MMTLYSAVPRLTCLMFGIVFALLEASATTNIILIVTDDQRWDATGFMQERMSSLGRTARFPWMEGNTKKVTIIVHLGYLYLSFTLARDTPQIYDVNSFCFVTFQQASVPVTLPGRASRKCVC